MTGPTIPQLHNLTDRAGAGLTADEQQRLRDGIDRLAHAEAELRTRYPADDDAQPGIAHTHLWDGGDLPDWLQLDHYRFDYGFQLVIHHPDGDTRPEPGWLLVHWTDDTVTVASPTLAERVYGPNGLAGRLARAERATDGELRRQLANAVRRIRDLERQRDEQHSAIARVRHLTDECDSQGRSSGHPLTVTRIREALEPSGPAIVRAFANNDIIWPD